MDFSQIYDYVLFQTNWYQFTLVLAVGIILFLLPYFSERLGQSKAQQFTNFLALVFIVIGVLNYGWWMRDHGQGVDNVNRARQQAIQEIQQMSNKR